MPTIAFQPFARFCRASCSSMGMCATATMSSQLRYLHPRGQAALARWQLARLQTGSGRVGGYRVAAAGVVRGGEVCDGVQQLALVGDGDDAW